MALFVIVALIGRLSAAWVSPQIYTSSSTTTTCGGDAVGTTDSGRTGSVAFMRFDL